MIDNPASDFEKMENELAAQIQAQAEFANLKNPDGTPWEVLTEDQGDILFLQRKMIDACGLSVIVLTITGNESPKFQQLPGPMVDPAVCRVQISEAVEFNRSPGGTNVRCETASSVVRRCLHLFTPNLPSVKRPLDWQSVDVFRETTETGALVTSRINVFHSVIYEQSKTIQ